MIKRRPLIAGNWKMHTTVMDACRLAAEIAKKYTKTEDRDVLVAPPFTVLSEVSHVVQKTPIIIGGQNICWEEKGAFTGEISPVMLKDAGGSCAIIGHSERRQIFMESDEIINRRVKGAVNFGLWAILCVGETLEEREKNITFEILERQIENGLKGIDGEKISQVIIAYEPVWAIGTGQTATKEQAQEAHSFIRGLIEKMYEKNVAEQLRILYGGSVKPDNVDSLMAQQDIDGALVGGAALDAESFGRIINFQ